MMNDLYIDQIKKLRDCGLLDLEEKASYTAEEKRKIELAQFKFFDLMYKQHVSGSVSTD